MKAKLKTKHRENTKDHTFLKAVLKGTLIALSISLVAILIFALIIRFCNVSDKVIMPINQVIKIVSVLLGTWLAMRKQRDKGLYKGLLIGFCYTIFAFLLFSALSGSISFSVTLLNDMLFGSVVGGLSGILFANLHKKA